MYDAMSDQAMAGVIVMTSVSPRLFSIKESNLASCRVKKDGGGMKPSWVMFLRNRSVSRDMRVMKVDRSRSMRLTNLKTMSMI